MENETPSGKKTSGFKLFILLVAGFVVLSFILQASGLKVMDVKEKDTMIKRPHKVD